MSRRRPNRGKEEAAPAVNPEAPLVLINACKDEAYGVDHGLKNFQRKFRTQFKLQVNRDDVVADTLAGAKAIVFAAPRKPFDPEEIKALTTFMQGGGGVLIMASEGLEGHSYDNINKLTEPLGITVNHDSVIRTVYHDGYFHPKEAFIKNVSCLANLDQLSGKTPLSSSTSLLFDSDAGSGEKLAVAYPYGCTLELTQPAVPIMSSGALCFPANRALGACSQVQRGRLVVMGAVGALEDQNFQKADNALLALGLLKLVTETTGKLDSVDPDRPEYGERLEIPDTEALADRVRACLQEGEELPLDFTQLFDHNLFNYTTNLIPAAVRLYDKLNVKHNPIALIPPQFEMPLPVLQPALFMPVLRELPPPSLELFDCDEAFASEKLRLAQLTNKCTDADLEYYVRESGDICGVSESMQQEKNLASMGTLFEGSSVPSTAPTTAKQILHFMLSKLVIYKNIEQDEDEIPHSMGMSMDEPIKSEAPTVTDKELEDINNLERQDYTAFV